MVGQHHRRRGHADRCRLVRVPRQQSRFPASTRSYRHGWKWAEDRFGSRSSAPPVVTRWLLPTLQLARRIGWMPPSFRSRSASAAEQRGSRFPSGTRCCGSTPRAATRRRSRWGTSRAIRCSASAPSGSRWGRTAPSGASTHERSGPARSSRPARARGASRSGRLRLGHEPLRRDRVANRSGDRRGRRDDRAGPLPAVARRGRRARLGRRRGHEGRTGRVRRRVPLDSPP